MTVILLFDAKLTWTKSMLGYYMSYEIKKNWLMFRNILLDLTPKPRRWDDPASAEQDVAKLQSCGTMFFHILETWSVRQYGGNKSILIPHPTICVSWTVYSSLYFAHQWDQGRLPLHSVSVVRLIPTQHNSLPNELYSPSHFHLNANHQWQTLIMTKHLESNFLGLSKYYCVFK